eukprot:2381116-Amphidinium_carterae.1
MNDSQNQNYLHDDNCNTPISGAATRFWFGLGARGVTSLGVPPSPPPLIFRGVTAVLSRPTFLTADSDTLSAFVMEALNTPDFGSSANASSQARLRFVEGACRSNDLAAHFT